MNIIKYKIRDIATVKNGSTPSTSVPEFYDGEITWITPKDLSNQNSRYTLRGERTISKAGFDSCSATMVPAGTILLSSRAPIGLLSIARAELCTNQGFKNIVPNKEKIDSEFLYYYLKIKIEDISKLGSGTTFIELSKNSIEDFQILIPEEVKDQQEIASVLSSLDSKIELNNRINAELEAMAKTLYDYWFVQFDFPDANGKPYKSSGGKMVWNEELKREIPEGWGVGKLGDIAELIRGVTYDSSEIRSQDESGVIPILRATNISGNVIDLDEMVYVSRENVSDVQVLRKYDILITMSSGSKEHIGKNGFFYYETEVAFGAFCAKIIAKSEYRFYLYSYTQSDFMFTTIKNECLGTNINNLNGSLVKGFKIIIPPIELIKSFNEKVSSAYEKIGNNMIENQKLSHLRDWLIPMLMNGQVRVGDYV